MSNYTTTTPDFRDLIQGPATYPALEVNLVLRIVLGISAALCCWVPMRLLWRNGEVAASLLCLDVITLNVLYVINAIIWPDDNVQTWFAGYGLCDLEAYITYPLDTIYAACIFEVVRGLASKISLSRSTSLSNAERYRNLAISAAVVFTIPVLQVVLNYLFVGQRYGIFTLIGCVPFYDYSAPFLVLYVLPLLIFTLGAGVFAVVIWWRFRALDLSTRSALGNSNNTNIASRQQKVRRKLYFVSVSILIPYLPLQILFFAQTIEFGMPWTIPYDFNRVHYGGDPLPSTLITFTTSLGTPFGIQNTNYIPILTAIPVFFVFGTTADAINSYRKFLLFFGLGVLFPRLHDEYVETRTTKAGKSFLSSWRTRSAAICSRTGNDSVLPIAERSCGPANGNRDDDTNPWPDLSATADVTAQGARPGGMAKAMRGFWPFRADVPTPIHMQSLGGRQKSQDTELGAQSIDDEEIELVVESRRG
ncbi:hypothetical protein P8C59_004796 [Phyllachora maydis]|uniref:Pheromone receptor n=1 Tax=Phyllachora maydis TaxID=1825666 RepID=A0AAD9MAT7_9PEZI|nr:hypothetical protein P8C59_004796 [Phyllachora maydis]